MGKRKKGGTPVWNLCERGFDLANLLLNLDRVRRCSYWTLLCESNLMNQKASNKAG